MEAPKLQKKKTSASTSSYLHRLCVVCTKVFVLITCRPKNAQKCGTWRVKSANCAPVTLPHFWSCRLPTPALEICSAKYTQPKQQLHISFNHFLVLNFFLFLWVWRQGVNLQCAPSEEQQIAFGVHLQSSARCWPWSLAERTVEHVIQRCFCSLLFCLRCKNLFLNCPQRVRPSLPRNSHAFHREPVPDPLALRP